jgi:hypothetical protein
MLACASTVVAQSTLPQSRSIESIVRIPATRLPLAANSTSEQLKAWASLSVGTINVNSGETSVPFTNRGGALSLWATRGKLAASIRAAGTMSEVGPAAGDISALVGVHVAPAPHVDAVAAIGAGQSSASWYPKNFATEPILAASAQANLNYCVAGLGFDTFAAIGSTRHYAGFGLTLALGWFR